MTTGAGIRDVAVKHRRSLLGSSMRVERAPSALEPAGGSSEVERRALEQRSHTRRVCRASHATRGIHKRSWPSTTLLT